AVVQGAALSLRGAPHRTNEIEMTLTLALRTRTRHDTRATQREVRVAERKAGDVGQATVEGGDEARTLALDRVRAGLVERFTARDVPLDLTQRCRRHVHARADREREPATGCALDDHFGADDVSAARGEVREHRDRAALVGRFADTPTIELEQRVRRDEHIAT